ncbi:MAG: polysaccharide deacetylase family protein [Flavipsychrobacter sp.]|nr:polysaccharide deacetylase family protein [Flavipsychrobacter sp.]
MRRSIVLFFLLYVSSLQAQILREPIPEKLVVLTFDDGAKSHYSYVAPLLKKYGFGATFFVCEFPPDYADTNKYMTWQQIKALNSMGFEIGNHTWHHKHVDKVDADTLNMELAYINDQCEKYGIPRPVSFAYPGYDTYAPAIKTLQMNGIVMARTGGSKLYDPIHDHPFYIPSFSAANKGKIFRVLKQDNKEKIIVLTVHGVPDLAHPWVTTSPKRFERYLQLLKAKGYKVIAMRDLNKYIDFRNAETIPLPAEY